MFFLYRPEFRIKDNFGDFYYFHQEFELKENYLEWLDISAAYKLAYVETGSDWSWRHRPHLNFNAKTNAGGLYLNNNIRFEFRLNEPEGRVYLYRNKMEASYLFENRLRPYSFDEIFFNINDFDFNMNRAEVGLYIGITERTNFALAYQLESAEDSSGWSHTSFLVTHLNYSF
ncbi:DUF2490 domain-containing protein [bacterium]|nr:DUF2490 domain-containing protein [bacterium]